MSVDLLLYVMIGVGAISAIASQRLVGAKQPTGPKGALALVGACRLLIVAGWIWFSWLTGYWQIAVLLVGVTVVGYAGILAKKASA